MTIELNVSNFRGIEMAKVVLDPIALVVGNNGQGKTSFAQASIAALTGAYAPGMAVTKKDASMLVRRNPTAASAAKVVDGVNTAMMRWPGCEYNTEGTPPKVSGFAAGTSRLTSLDGVKRAAALSTYLKSEPSDDELKDALTTALEVYGDNEARITKVVAMVRAEGWDAAEKAARNAATLAKGAWGQVTGRTWGKSISDGWMPEGWDEFSLNGDLEELEKDTSALEDRQKQAIAAEAVMGADLNNLETAAEKLGELEAVAADVKGITEIAQKALDEFNKLPEPPEPVTADSQPLECPHCKGKVLVQTNLTGPRTSLVAFDPSVLTPEAEAQKMLQARVDHSKKRQEMKAKVDEAQKALNLADNDVVKCKEDGKKLTQLREQQAAIDNQDSSEELGTQIKRNRDLMKALKSVEDAAEQTKRVTINTAIADVLAADGLREKKLIVGLDQANEQLAAMCKSAGWPKVSIAMDLSIRYDSFPYEGLSEGEKFRVNITLQIWMADLDGSEVVVIDGADILDGRGRNGLFKILKGCQSPRWGRTNPLRALVCMTASTKEDAANLEDAKLGKTYWLEAGKIV